MDICFYFKKNSCFSFMEFKMPNKHEILFRPVFHQLHNHGLHYLREKNQTLSHGNKTCTVYIDETTCLVDQLVVAGTNLWMIEILLLNYWALMDAYVISKIMNCVLTQYLVIWCNIIGAIFLTSIPIFHARTKHIKIDYHFIWEKIVNKDVQVYHISTED